MSNHGFHCVAIERVENIFETRINAGLSTEEAQRRAMVSVTAEITKFFMRRQQEK